MNKHKQTGTQNVLITGASSGIGKATAQLLVGAVRLPQQVLCWLVDGPMT